MPAKPGRFNRAEKYYIINNPDELTITQLAKDLKRSSAQVQKLLDTYQKELVKQGTQPDTKHITTVRKDTHMQQLMGRHKRNNKFTSAIMTPAASELSDVIKTPAEVNTKSIHKPYDD